MVEDMLDGVGYVVVVARTGGEAAADDGIHQRRCGHDETVPTPFVA
jgi:hypothetical protein